jgi:hypothetical protein
MDTYWFLDPKSTLLNVSLLDEFFPTIQMSYPRKVNAMVRGTIYLAILLGLFYQNYLFVYLPLAVMLLTYILYLHREQSMQREVKKIGPQATFNDLPKPVKEEFMNYLNLKEVAVPTVDNPFMNAMPFDSRTRPAAELVNTHARKMAVENKYDTYLMKDSADIFNKNGGRREFYTTANTQYPNDQGGFADWLYKTPRSCREGNPGACLGNLYTSLGLYSNSGLYNVFT